MAEENEELKVAEEEFETASAALEAARTKLDEAIASPED